MDEKYMRQAIELAEKGRGRTSPNPLVGAVVVQDGKVVGTGYHAQAGKPHAEVNALKESGNSSVGATLYSTLEPCCNYGWTPPCTDSIISVGVKRVVVGLIDPNPEVCGRGVERLKAAGISVTKDILSEEIAKQNEIFIKYITTGRPFVLMKVAMSLDGKITSQRGKTTVLTSEHSLCLVHRLRDECDAIMVGIGTVLADNPQLTARLPGGKTVSPVRIIADSKARLPLKSKIVSLAKRVPTILATTEQAPPDKLKQLGRQGVEILVCSSNEGWLDLEDLMGKLGQRKITSVLLEGGARINTSVLRSGLVDKFLFFIAPQLMSSPEALGMVEEDISQGIGGRVDLEFSQVGKVGPDLLIEAYPRKGLS